MSLSTFNRSGHVTWDCTYHIVIVPKYHKKVLYDKIRQRAGAIIRELAEQKGVTVIEGHACPDHIHMILSIPPKYSVAHVIGFLKGKSAIRLHHEFSSKQKCITKKNFWTRGYFVRTIGLDQQQVEEYVRNQEEDDKREDENPQFDLQWD